MNARRGVFMNNESRPPLGVESGTYNWTRFLFHILQNGSFRQIIIKKGSILTLNTMLCLKNKTFLGLCILSLFSQISAKSPN